MSSNAEMRATVGRITGRMRRGMDVRDVWEALKERLAGTPRRREQTVKWLKIGGPVAAVALGVSLWLVLRPVPQPDYAKDSLKRVFNYTLLTDEFNRLPVEERLKLIGQLVDRLKNMTSGDSQLMAAFAVGIAGAARDQIEQNISHLMIDMWDKYAADYVDVPAADRGNFLDQKAVELVRTLESMTGETSNKTDAELLSDMHAQAKRDEENLKDPNRRPPARAMGRLFGFMRGNIGDHATPAQRGRGQLMMRDMVRRMRGEDGGPR